MNSYVKLLEKLNNGEIEKCKKMLLENIREESAKKSGAKKPYSIIKTMFSKDNGSMSEKAFLNCDDRFYFSDGHRFFSATESFGYKEIDKLESYKFIDMFKGVDFSGTLNIDYAKIKESVAINKSLKSKWNIKPFIIYDPENDIYCGFNPNFLKDLIDFTGMTKFVYQPNKSHTHNSKNKCLISPIFAIDENNNCLGCVLPVNITNIEPENMKNSDYIVYCENIA